MNASQRNSNFELLRLILIYFIVTYHSLVCVYFNDAQESEPLFKALWIPLHIAVVCFVLISGYFHIRPSLRGAVKLLLPIIVYFTIPCVIAGFLGCDLLRDRHLEYIFFLSKSPYWFIRTYFCLFLIAPLLNKWLDNSNMSYKKYLLLCLAFISVYEALMGVESVTNGKNIALFMFLYVLGDYLKSHTHIFNQINLIWLIISWFCFNILLTISWLLSCENIVGSIIWRLSFPYSSPLLILNAVWFFLIFCRLNFQSAIINSLARSVFSLYILTEHIIFKPLFLVPFLSCVFKHSGNSIYIVSGVCLTSFIVILACIALDNIFQPFFKFVLSKI